MKKVINTERVPIKLWLDDLEEGALRQAKNLANLPFTYKWVSIMPDSHFGYGMPIGGVLPTDEVVIPNAVGVDIGCGMCVVKSNIKNPSTEDLKQVMGIIRKTIPVGFNWFKKPQADLNKEIEADHTDIITPQIEKAQLQLGTLGGGNHFIELQTDASGHLYIMIHSGSRNLGALTAEHYNKTAKEMNKKWQSDVPEDWSLAFLPIDSQEGQDYLKDMDYCTEFALKNRMLMMERGMNAIYEVFPDAEFGEIWNEPHNFARMEDHFGKNVMVHRKGATSAKEGELGMIPGSQGTASYLVKGKGNSESFMSCSHGSGRMMGRKQAIKNLSVEEEVKKLDEKGVIHAIRGKKDLDEAPGSYKDIETVMENQEDLVDVVEKLEPKGVVKG